MKIFLRDWLGGLFICIFLIWLGTDVIEISNSINSSFVGGVAMFMFIWFFYCPIAFYFKKGIYKKK